MSTAELIRSARTHRGLSQRALAARAGVEQSTVARIENGSADPTYTTVVRLLDAAGYRFEAPQPTLPTLAEAALGGDELDWTMIRAVTDRSERHQADIALMIGAEPPATASNTARTVLAAIASFVADRGSVAPPRWVRTAQPLSEPWQLLGTPQMLRRTMAETPPQLARLNVWLRADALTRG